MIGAGEDSASEVEDDRAEDAAFPAGPVPQWMTGPRRRMWMDLSLALAREKARMAMRKQRGIDQENERGGG